MSEFSFEALEPVCIVPPVTPTDPLAAALADADAVRATARDEGFAEGLAAGEAAGRERLDAAASALDAATAALEEERARQSEVAERAAVELALALATKVVSGVIETEPERVLDVVRGALRALVDRERVTLLVHPDDLELVHAEAGGLRAELGGIERLEVQAERRVGRGGALLRTTEGEVDARLETKLERARELFSQ